MAGGARLLDSSGNLILDSSGNVFLSDGETDNCCCGPTPTPCTCCPDATPAAYLVTISGATMWGTCQVCNGGATSLLASVTGTINGTYRVPQVSGQPCLYQLSIPVYVNFYLAADVTCSTSVHQVGPFTLQLAITCPPVQFELSVLNAGLSFFDDLEDGTDCMSGLPGFTNLNTSFACGGPTPFEGIFATGGTGTISPTT
jgi:hypothetical protein